MHLNNNNRRLELKFCTWVIKFCLKTGLVVFTAHLCKSERVARTDTVWSISRKLRWATCEHPLVWEPQRRPSTVLHRDTTTPNFPGVKGVEGQGRQWVWRGRDVTLNAILKSSCNLLNWKKKKKDIKQRKQQSNSEEKENIKFLVNYKPQQPTTVYVTKWLQKRLIKIRTVCAVLAAFIFTNSSRVTGLPLPSLYTDSIISFNTDVTLTVCSSNK